MFTAETISDREYMDVYRERGHVELSFDTSFIKFEIHKNLSFYFTGIRS